MSQVVSGSEWLNLGNVNFTPNGQLIISPFNELGQGFRVVDRMTGQSTEPPFFTSSRDLIEDMALDGAGVLYASVFSADRVSVFNVDRTFRRDLQAPGLDGPTGIAINYRCEIIVASFYTAPGAPQIFVFSPEGELLRSVVVPELGLPESIAIVGQILPGSFEFPPAGNELTPACDNFEPPVPFDGSLPDVGPRDAGTGDAGALSRSSSSCGCRLVSQPQRNMMWIGLLGCASLVIIRRRRNGHH